MIIEHHPDTHRFETYVDGLTAYAEYRISGGVFDIIHTFVPPPLEGRGIAAALVKAAYGYAQTQNHTLHGSCSYADAWLRRHPNG